MRITGFSVLLFLVICVIASSPRVHAYPEAGGPKGETSGPSDCPLQCRCIALSHLGYRAMAERWMSAGSRAGNGNTIWKGTEAPVWQEDPSRLQGRDVVCMGMNKVPRPLPKDSIQLTLLGDSGMDPDEDPSMAFAHAQLSTIRENSFVHGERLEKLTLSSNDLRILYPFIFRSLAALKYLALQNNNIQHISAAAFSTLGKLKELRLSDNTIRFLSPNVFSELVGLEFLYLNGNKLANMHPHLLRRLKSLKYLDISRNNFRSFDDSVFDGAVNLEELLINENRIVTVRAEWFQSLSRLKSLEIKANVITRIDPSSFSTATSLESLSLSANVINTVSNEAFRNLSRLQLLDIGTNDISNLEPHCFAGLDSLDKLDLSVNKLSFINNRTFTVTPTLRSLDLSKNSIKDIEEAALHPLATLEELSLSNNKLKAVKSKTFSGLMELNEVNLDNNLITEIEDDAFIVAPLNQLSKITWLSLQYNRIKSLNAYSLFGLPHLKFLNVGHNKLKNIHVKTFYTHSSLQNLLMYDNKISQIEDGTFSNLKQLQSLSLENNKLAAIKEGTFKGLKNVNDLNLVSNAIEVTSQNAFRYLENLKRLDMNNNYLSRFSFSELALVKELTYVDLSSNRLYDIEFPNDQSHTIRHLLLSNNRLQTLVPAIVNVLAPLGNVWLGKNPWSCDCRMEWLQRYTAEYRLRLLGSRETICMSPSIHHGKKVTSLARTDFRCDNTTLLQSLTCQNLQVRRSKEPIEHVRKGKQESRRWHVTFPDDRNNATSNLCYGVLLNDNWVLTRSTCSHIDSSSADKVKVTVGRRETREVSLYIDHAVGNFSESANLDLRLVRLVTKESKSKEATPCILTHSQYHELAFFLQDAIFTTRVYKNSTGEQRLLAKRGKIVNKCGNSGDVCLRLRGDPSSYSLQGSPLSMRYQGIWYLAGLGATDKTGADAETGSAEGAYNTFTPLWKVTSWLADTMHAIDSKCQFQRRKWGHLTVLCENLDTQGKVVPVSDFLSV